MLIRDDHFLFEERRYVLLDVLASDEPALAEDVRALVIDLDDPTAWTTYKNYREVTTRGAKLNTQAEMLKQSVASRFASDATKALRDRAWKDIAPLVADPRIHIKGERWELICRRASECNTTPGRLARLLRMFWRGGQTLDALLGNLSNRGKLNGETANRRGRKPTKPGRSRFYATARDHERFRSVIESFYLDGEVKTISDTLQHLWEKHYSYVDGNGKRFIKPDGELPTLRQFSHFLQKNYSLEARLRGRKGDKAVERNHRPVLGTVAQVCRGVGHIYEMDATIADVRLCSRINRADFIGRPVIYFIIDRESRLIVGWYVGLENASWRAARQAIFSIAEDKKVLCERLGLEYDSDDWPAHGILGQEFYMDRGEGVGRNATLLTTGLGATVTNLPSCRPDWKPLVERMMALHHRSMADTVPGYNPAALAGRRREKDYGDEGAMTLDEFESIFVKDIISHNRLVMKSYPLNASHLAARTVPSPINLWNHGVSKRVGQLVSRSADFLRLALLPNGEAVVSEYGIFINNCYYMPEDGSRRSLFVEGRVRVSQLKASFDERRVDKIYVHDEKEPAGFFTAKLTPRSEHFAGMSVDEVAYWIHVDEQLHSGADASKRQTRLEFHEHADPIVKNAAKQAAQATQGVSKSARHKNTKEVRKAHLELERDRLVPSAPTPSTAQATPLALAASNSKVVVLRPVAAADAPQPAVAASQAANQTTGNKLLDAAARMRERMLGARGGQQ